MVDFPTLGDIADAWVKRHCRQPDGYRRGAEFAWSDWQFWCSANYYRIRPGAQWASEDRPLFNQAFVYRRGQVVAPQKALALDTPIATPAGWSTMGELRPGDEVLDETGRPTRILSKSPVWLSDTYRVTFTGGASLVACKDHQWLVERRNRSGKYMLDRVRTEDLLGNLADAAGAYRFRVPNARPIALPARYILAVERIDTVPTQCLTVEAASHVFLAGREMIPTCNTGKGPWGASVTCVEAAGPSQFLGWAGKGDGWACSDWGCGCGWEYEYLLGEPMGMRHPSPVIQLTANNEDQVGNVYRPLTAMIRLGPLGDLMAVREGFIRIMGEVGGEDFDRIDAVTSSARGRVGNPVSWVLQDETGLYTQQNKMVGIAETQRRGAAGMGGRTLETTNAWDPAENSTAQRTYESQAPDIFKFFRIPPAGLSWKNKRERRKILRHVYEGSPWVDLDSIEAEAVELNELDPAQSERFFGNRLVARAGSWLPAELWESAYAEALAS